MKTIVIGLGNPILGDDGIGWKVAERSSSNWRLIRLSMWSFFPRRDQPDGTPIGYERAILIDAVTSDQEIGSVIVSNLNEMPDYSAFHITSAHDTSLQTRLSWVNLWV